MTEHSPFGGSGAARVIGCPASVGLIEKVPVALRRTSAYAERGTALHAAMALLIEEKRHLDDLVGETFNNYRVTDDDVELALQPAYGYVTPRLDAPDAAFYLEHRVEFPSIAGAFGTADLIVRVADTISLIDFKFGGGVPIRALYPRGDEDVLNSQLMFYGAAARHSLPEFFAGVESIILTIVQPTSIEPDAEIASSVEITHAELDAFTEVYRSRCEESASPTPRLERGDHCRFCPARPICPAHTGPLLDLAQFRVPTPGPDKAAYLEALALGLDLVDRVKDVGTALRDQAKAVLDAGDIVPGFALSAGRAERRWRDDKPMTIAALERLGLSRADVIEEAIRSVKQIEIRAKARGLKIPPEFVVSTRSGTALVRVENARLPVLGRDEIARLFAEALKDFQKGW